MKSHPTLFNNIIEGAYDFFHRDCTSNIVLKKMFNWLWWSRRTTVVVSVREDYINIVEPKTSQWFLGAFNDAK